VTGSKQRASRELKQFSALVLDGLLVGRDPDVECGAGHIEIVTPSKASGS